MKGKRRKSKGKCRYSSIDVMPSLPKQCRNVSARSETSCCFYYLMRRETWVDGYIHRAKKLQLCRLDKAGAHGIIKQKGTLLPQSAPN